MNYAEVLPILVITFNSRLVSPHLVRSKNRNR